MPLDMTAEWAPGRRRVPDPSVVVNGLVMDEHKRAVWSLGRAGPVASRIGPFVEL